MQTPYTDLPPRSFWKTGVAAHPPGAIADLYARKFPIGPKMAIATAGSCFAQHIARHLRAAGANVLDLEPTPEGLPPALAEAYGYGLFTARYANIYVARQMLQLAQEALGQRQPVNWVWSRDGKLVDGLRPNIDPDGFDSLDELAAHRRQHLGAVARMLRGMDLMVLTLGLTESWIDQADGTVYPSAPGVAAVPPEGADLTFHNMRFAEVKDDVLAFRALVHSVNPGCRFLLTVSPVPLTATAEPMHVLMATMHSKSVLRAVAGEVTREHEDIDYFPSYELIASHVAAGGFFEANRRSVTPQGVEAAMSMFMAAHGDALKKPARGKRKKGQRKGKGSDRAVCEEELLEAFAK